MDLQSFQNQYNQANQQAQGYQNQLTQLQGSAKNPQDFYNTAAQGLGVNDVQSKVGTARDAVNQTNQLLANLPGAVQGQVNGTLTTESQRQRLLAQQQQPLMQNYQQQSTNYGDLSNQYQNLQNQAYQQANLGYQGQQNQIQGLQGLYGNATQQAQSALGGYQQAQNYQLQQQQLAAQQKAAAASQVNPFAGVLEALSKPQGQIGTAASTNPQDRLMSGIANYLQNYQQKFLPGYTERTVRPQLEKQYAGIFSPDQIAQAVYGYRKQNYGE